MADAPRNLLLCIVVLAALLVGAIVATAKADAWWMVAVAVAALVVAAGLIGASVSRMLRDDEDVVSSGVSRRGVAASVAVVVVAIAVAVTLPLAKSAGASTAHPTAEAAGQTVRDFLASAVLDDNAYTACQYLTPGAQQQIARVAGNGQTCRDALTATRPSFAGIDSEGSLHALALHAVVRDATAYVTATGSGHRPATFVLRRTTGDEAAAYEAPRDAWRIAAGALAVLRP